MKENRNTNEHVPNIEKLINNFLQILNLAGRKILQLSLHFILKITSYIQNFTIYL